MDGRHLPDPDWPLAKPFWDGCRAGELRIPRCTRCGRFVWYPAPVCAHCGGEDHPWTAVDGRGGVFTWVRVHRAFVPGLAERVPYVTALVALDVDPGVRLATFLRDVPASGPRVGMAVVVVFEPVSDRLVLPAFRCLA